jgi:hypothetical protein
MKLLSPIGQTKGIFSWHYCSLFLIVCINLLARGWENDLIALSRDEPFTIYFSQLSIRQFVPIILETNNPPSFELLLHGWAELFGNDIRTLRWLPCIIMSLAAIPIFNLGKRIGGNMTAIMSSLLYLGSSFLMNVSHLDRAYCILITGSVFMGYLFIRIFETGFLRYQILWIATAVITCYSHYFGWLIVITLWVALLTVSDFRKSLFAKMLRATLALLACYLPLIIYLTNRFFITQKELQSSYFDLKAQRFTSLIGEFLNSDSITLALAAASMAAGLWMTYRKKFVSGTILIGFSSFTLITSFLSNKELSTSAQIILIAVLIMLSVSALLAVSKNQSSPVIKLLVYWTLVPLLLGFLLSYRMPIFVDRYFSFTIPAILLLVIALLNEVPHKGFQLVFFGLVFSFYLWNFDVAPKYYVDHRPAVEAFRDYHAQTDLSIVGPGYFDFDFAYYFDRRIFYNGKNQMTDTLGEKISSDNSYVRFKEGFRRELRRHHIVVSNDSSTLQLDTLDIKSVALFDGNLSLAYPENGLFEYVKSRYGDPVSKRDFSGLYTIYLFRK